MESQRKIFISRRLSKSSPFHAVVAKNNLSISNYSLIEFSGIPFKMPVTNWLFFYSRNGVKYFFEHIHHHNDLKNKKIACYGPSTAETCRKYHPVHLSFNAEASDTAKELTAVLKNESVTFICGRNSLRVVQKLMDASQYDEVIVYDHRPRTDLTLGNFDICILTSPMNAATFFKNKGLAKVFIAIGPTTAQSINEFGYECYVAASPSEAELCMTLSHILAD